MLLAGGDGDGDPEPYPPSPLHSTVIFTIVVAATTVINLFRLTMKES